MKTEVSHSIQKMQQRRQATNMQEQEFLVIKQSSTDSAVKALEFYKPVIRIWAVTEDYKDDEAMRSAIKYSRNNILADINNAITTDNQS